MIGCLLLLSEMPHQSNICVRTKPVQCVAEKSRATQDSFTVDLAHTYIKAQTLDDKCFDCRYDLILMEISLLIHMQISRSSFVAGIRRTIISKINENYRSLSLARDRQEIQFNSCVYITQWHTHSRAPKRRMGNAIDDWYLPLITPFASSGEYPQWSALVNRRPVDTFHKCDIDNCCGFGEARAMMWCNNGERENEL